MADTQQQVPLDELQLQVQTCRACPLWEGRTQVVFGTGASNARVLLVGEAPGAEEDAQGIPFVGRSGQLLTQLLENAGIPRSSIYIANILKCRPPGNRNPLPEEIQACTPWLREQTRSINPEYIVTVGNFATQFILKTDQGVTKLRGRVHEAGRFKVYPVFHPAYALRNRNTVLPQLEADLATLGSMLAD